MHRLWNHQLVCWIVLILMRLQKGLCFSETFHFVVLCNSWPESKVTWDLECGSGVASTISEVLLSQWWRTDAEMPSDFRFLIASSTPCSTLPPGGQTHWPKVAPGPPTDSELKTSELGARKRYSSPETSLPPCFHVPSLTPGCVQLSRFPLIQPLLDLYFLTSPISHNYLRSCSYN